MTSYITLLNKIEAFCNAHIQIQKYGGEFREQMPNFSTKNEKYPIVFVEPVSDTEDIFTNQFSINVYCVDVIQKDRQNLNTILSDCQLILKDLYTYYSNDMDSSLDVIGTATMNPLNNLDLDYVAGWVMSITFEVAAYGACEIPMEPITPTPVECQDGSVQNTDASYTNTVESGGLLILQDVRLIVIDQNSNILSDAMYPSVQDETIEVFIAPCEDARVMNSNDTYTQSIASGDTLQLPDVRIVVQDQNGVKYSDNTYPSVQDETIDIYVAPCEPATYDLFNSVPTLIESGSIPCGDNATLYAPNGTVHIKHEADGTIANVSTPSNGVVDYTILNNHISVNNANGFAIHAEEPLDVRLKTLSGTTIPASSVAYNGNQHYVDVAINTASFVPVGAKLLKTGQTISYNSNDDGATQRGRSTDRLTLASNNPFGNTNRFTNKTGGSTYTTKVTYDWSTFDGSTVLAYYFGDMNSTRSLVNQCDQYVNTTYDGLRGWYLTNMQEMINILDWSKLGNYQLNYPPFSTTNRYFWVSTQPIGTQGVITDLAGVNPFSSSPKTSALYGIWCRVCNVNGTTIS